MTKVIKFFVSGITFLASLAMVINFVKDLTIDWYVFTMIGLFVVSVIFGFCVLWETLKISLEKKIEGKIAARDAEIAALKLHKEEANKARQVREDAINNIIEHIRKLTAENLIHAEWINMLNERRAITKEEIAKNVYAKYSLRLNMKPREAIEFLKKHFPDIFA